MTCCILAVVPDIAQADILDEITAMMEPWNGALLHLLKAPITPGRAVTLAEADAAEADYTGYMAIAIVWQAAAKGSDGIVSADTQAAQFLASGVVLSNSIYGAYITNMAGTELLAIAALPEAIVMGVDLLQAVDIQLRVQLTNNIGG